MTSNFDIPDFSGDDFANDKEIQRIRAQEQAYNKMVNDSLTIIQDKLGVVEASHKNLKGFEMFKNLQAIVVRSLRAPDSNNSLHVSLAQYTSSIPSGKHSNISTDQYLFGHFEMRRTYPPTYIYKETLSEKIAGIFLNNELDFKHSKKFSRKFHVLTHDKRRLSELLQFKDLDELARYPEMELEIQGDAVLFRSSRKAVSPEEAERFCRLAKVLVRVFD